MSDCTTWFAGNIDIKFFPENSGPNNCFSLVDKDNTAGDIALQQNYWTEQINLYGQKVGYYVNNYSVLSGADNLYGEHPTQVFSPPKEVKMLIQLNDNAIMLSQYGLQSDDEVTAFITISAFYAAFGPNAEPKSGDLFQLTEFGQDRPGGRRGRFFEITQRNDEDSAQINPLMGHYVWEIKAKRFEYSFEPGLSAIEVDNNLLTLQQIFDDTRSPSVSGVDKPYPDNADTIGREIVFDYTGTNFPNQYGGY